MAKPNKYIPAGTGANVRGTFCRNLKIAAHLQAMFMKWSVARAVLKPNYTHKD